MSRKLQSIGAIFCVGLFALFFAMPLTGRADFISPNSGSVQALASEEWPAFVVHKLDGALAVRNFADSGARDVDIGSGRGVIFDLPRRLGEDDVVIFDLQWVEWRTLREYRVEAVIPVVAFNLYPVRDTVTGRNLAPMLDFRVFTGHNGYVQIFGPSLDFVNYINASSGEKWDSFDPFSGRAYELVWKGCAEPSSGLLQSQLGTPWMNDILDRNPVSETEAARRTVDNVEGLPCKRSGE